MFIQPNSIDTFSYFSKTMYVVSYSHENYLDDGIPDSSLMSTHYICYQGKNNRIFIYSKCPKISYTKVSDKWFFTNSAYPDQTAPEGAV